MKISRIELTVENEMASLLLCDDEGNSCQYRQADGARPFDNSHRYHIMFLATGRQIMPPLLEADTFPKELLVNHGYVTEIRFVSEAQ